MMIHRHLILTVGFLLFHLGSFHLLPPCKKYADTYGSWYNVSQFDGTNANEAALDKKWYDSHFHQGFSGESLNFTYAWLPNSCSYRRFTSESIHEAVNKTLKSLITKHSKTSDKHEEHEKPEQLQIVFVGDSALRGIVCGIGRILLGSESFGPNENIICGGIPGQQAPSSFKAHGRPLQVDYGNMRITFVYVKSFYILPVDFDIGDIIFNHNPYAIVLNTGIWDFDDLIRSTPRELNNGSVSESCLSENTTAISLLRSSTYVHETLLEADRKAKDNDVRLIYRNNHQNVRFGTLCADERFEALLYGTSWELWDNRRMSDKVSLEQNYDGFHFDRTKVFTHESHMHHRNFCLSKGWEVPGQLEIQLAQSLLNNLFFDFL